MTQLPLLSLLALSYLVTFSVGLATRRFDREITASILTSPGCNGSLAKNGFQQLIVHNGSVFVGATNHILHLSRDLRVLNVFRNGPANDSENCKGPTWCNVGDLCTSTYRCANNYNRILLTYRNWLLACGTLYEVCDLLQLDNIALPFGNVTELQCRSETRNSYSAISSRNRAQMVVAAIHTDRSQINRDVLYLGKPGSFMKSFIAPSINTNYFSLTDKFNGGSKANYHLAWTTESYGYILWTNASTLETRLSRYCNRPIANQNRVTSDYEAELNAGIRSYTDISITCQHAVNVVSAKYQYGRLYILYRDEAATTLCSANLTALNDRFNFVRQQCYQSATGYLHAKHFYSNCTSGFASSYSEEWSTCVIPELVITFSTPDVGVIGVNPFDLTNLMNLDLSDNATSFVVSHVNDIYSVFLGTNIGDVLKIRHDTGLSTIIERFTSNANNSILNSMAIYDDEMLYTISDDEILQVRLAACEQYATCTACLEARDPYCGWCVQDSMCSEKRTCNDSSNSQRWIGSGMISGSCPRISVIQPNIISVGQRSTKIALTFAGAMLKQGLAYQCAFVTERNRSLLNSPLENFDANTRTGRCDFPAFAITALPAESDYENITVSIEYDQRQLASGALRVYSCAKAKTLNNYTMCSSCISGDWGCTWCMASDTCNNNNDNSPPCSAPPATSYADCPRVLGISNQPTLVPVGRRHLFFLQTRALQQKITEEFTCQYHFCGRTGSSQAVINPSSLIAECTVTADMLTCLEPSSTVEVLLRQDDYVIDTPSRDSVTGKLYNCSADAISGSCARCIGFSRECSDCVWCPGLRKCATRDTCPSDAVQRIEDCNPPSISSISPASGPFNGGTRVSIMGSNLGSNISEIASVRVGRINCAIIPELYIPSRRIVCETGIARSNSDSGTVLVTTTYGRSARSTRKFSFIITNVSKYSPRVALDRTTVTIEGRRLDIGNKAVVYFENNAENNVTCVSRKRNSMKCQLPAVAVLGNYSLTVAIDNYRKTLRGKIRVARTPRIIGTQMLRGFKSGGGSIELPLSSLDGVITASLRVGLRPRQNCTIQKEKVSLLCRISPHTALRSRQRRQAANDWEATLLLNGNIAIPLGTVTYFPDPELAEIKDIPCHNKRSANANRTEDGRTTRTVQIPGRNFELTRPLKSEYSVTLLLQGTKVVIPCEVTFMEDTSLFCRTPSDNLRNYSARKFTIKVTIGDLTLTKRNVEYCAKDNTTLIAISVAVPIVGVLLIVILVLLMWHRKRVKKQARERSLILKKLDDLENKTREQARNAYYELQVGYMNNLSDNITRRITYRAPELYFIQTLFNLAGDHPVLDRAALQQEAPTYEAICEWTELLKEKEFLMTFIRTLEEQKKFTIQEKGNVASLLVVSFFNDMPYFTNIMFDLLTELIQRHLHKNPKLLLRRSESVVEKMVSHWLSITLYDECIMGKSGEPLFLLTKAIHYLVSSAPCDVIAQKSVNSLNESTLLSTEISYGSRLLLASMQEENGNPSKPVEVTVVDVDSITQVKQKIIDEIYKDKPFSECPKPDDLDFELLGNGEPGEGVILSDVDGTSEKQRNHVKINTLKHYNVQDKARVILRPAGTMRPPDPFSGGYQLFYDRNNSFSYQIRELSTSSPDWKTPLLNNGHGNGRTNNVFHLINPREDEISNGYGDFENSTTEKRADALLEGMINRPFQEIYLTRMVRSKTTLQEYVDGVFKSILCPDPIPIPVRYFFQFLDREAIRHGITDPEVSHIWKSNSLLLRYWVNILKNPEFLFDVNKTPIVDSCLSVITQAFMDACSTTTTRKLGQDSPSNKLLYAKDAENYKSMVNNFFKKVSDTTWIRDEDVDQALIRVSQQYSYKFNPRVACQQLYQYMFKYKDLIISAIRHDANEGLARRVERVTQMMERRQGNATTLV